MSAYGQQSRAVAGGAALAADDGSGAATRNMSVRRKKYCPRCATRVSRSAKRCGYCGACVAGLARLAAGALVIAALMLSLGFLLGFL